MKKEVLISVGIAAYNEEPNIKKVLTAILNQKETGWKLKEVLVLCDGCTDKTSTKAKEIQDKRITVIEDGKRKGKTQRLNELFQMFSGDILVMFDGDIGFSGNSVVTKLIQPFLKDDKVMVVGGNSRPYRPKTFVEKAVYATFSVFYESRKKIRKGNNIFGATGSILAGRSAFLKKMKLPQIVSEDAFIYMTCISKKFKFKYVDNAVIYYKLPKNFSDYIKQVLRSNPESVTVELEPYFGKKVHKEFHRPFSFYAKNVFMAFINNPIGVTTIMAINILCRPLHSLVIKNYNLNWFTAHSTHS